MFALRASTVETVCLGTYRDGWCISSSDRRGIFISEEYFSITKFSEKKMEIIHRVKDKSACLLNTFTLSDKSVTSGLDASLRWQFAKRWLVRISQRASLTNCGESRNSGAGGNAAIITSQVILNQRSAGLYYGNRPEAQGGVKLNAMP